ncbi:MAG: hypothetical protein QXH19_05135 [Candidatus Bathyarchaeia archaeon]
MIEHLEPEIGRWLCIEYAHASTIVGRDKLIFTNIKNKTDMQILSELGTVKEESFAELFKPADIIILDPRAKEILKSEDFRDKRAVIVGGILGDHPPRGRTRKLITSRVPDAIARNIGKGQFSIDGAIYIAKMVYEGVRLEDIPIKRGIHIRLDERAEIYLPYVYPIRDGKPLISEELIKYLTSEDIVDYEERLLRGEE